MSHGQEFYEVIVGNIGLVYSGTDLQEAMRRYEAYVEQSRSDRGRVSGEPVALLRDKTIFLEFFNPAEELEISEYPEDPEAVNPRNKNE